MRVVDLDRDMRDVIPTGTTRESEFLFARMAERTLRASRTAAGERVLDVAAGLGQDASVLAARGALAVAAEPSARMTALAKLVQGREAAAQRGAAERSAGPCEVGREAAAQRGAAERSAGPCEVGREAAAQRGAAERSSPVWVRAWSDALPFASATFDAVICKGSLDHFDRPRAAIGEMARVAKPAGRVVLAVANFEAAACRAARRVDALREGWLGRELPRGRRHYDVPHDHFTRYDLRLLREQAAEWIDLELVEGVSLAWGFPGWSRAVAKLPAALARASLQALDALARHLPSLADVVILAGPPRRAAAEPARRSATSSA
jgi:SAM-dependent methyltransferase